MDRSVIDLFSELADNDFGFFQKLTDVAGLMTAPVETVTLDHTHEDVCRLFGEHGFHHAPVVADDGEVVGIISDRDLLRFQPPYLGKAAEGDHDHRAAMIPSVQFMTRGVVSISESDSPIAALSAMIDNHVDCVLVHNELGQLQGIVTHRAFLKLVLLFHRVCSSGQKLVRFRLVDLDLRQGFPLDLLFSQGAASTRDVMTKKVISIPETATLETAIHLMQTHEVRHLPVVDGKRRVVGMLSDREILRALPTPDRSAIVQRRGFREELFEKRGSSALILDSRVGALANRRYFQIGAAEFMSEAIEQFLERNQSVSGLAVVDDARHLVGIVTTTDVLRVIRNTLKIGAFLRSDHRETPSQEAIGASC